jgi:hypothetical protein
MRTKGKGRESFFWREREKKRARERRREGDRERERRREREREEKKNADLFFPSSLLFSLSKKPQQPPPNNGGASGHPRLGTRSGDPAAHLTGSGRVHCAFEVRRLFFCLNLLFRPRRKNNPNEKKKTHFLNVFETLHE